MGRMVRVSTPEFNGLVAVVTGAASGIGRAASARLETEGARVVELDRAFDAGDEGVSIGKRVRCDVANATEVAAAAQSVLGRLSRCDVLVNCAGVAPVGDAVSCTEEEWDRAFAVNTKGTWLACRAFLPAMVEAGGGAIVNVASGAGLRPAARMAVYSASKAAVISLTRSIARDFAHQGVRANVLCPGPVDTPLHRETVVRRGTNANDAVESDEGFLAAEPASVEEMAQYVVMLASPTSRSLNAAALVADSGRVMY